MTNFYGSVMLCLALLIATATATQFKVGGSNGWSVPADPNAMSYNQWAEHNRFQIGDSLLFVYPSDKDSVLEVEKPAYDSCNTSSYIQRFTDGNTMFTFYRSGLFYFISGVEENCIKSESLVVAVLAERNLRPNQPSLPPSPSSASPPPPPTASSPPPSPSGSTEVPPSSAPAAEETSPPPPPNGASMKVVSFMGSIGTLLGALFVL